MPIKKGDKVTIKPEWCSDGEAQLEWFAIDDEEKGRVTIRDGSPDPVETVDGGFRMRGSQTVHVDMLETGRDN